MSDFDFFLSSSSMNGEKNNKWMMEWTPVPQNVAFNSAYNIRFETFGVGMSGTPYFLPLNCKKSTIKLNFTLSVIKLNNYLMGFSLKKSPFNSHNSKTKHDMFLTKFQPLG